MSNKHNKQSNMAGVGALPLLIILGLIIGTGYFLIGGEVEIPFFKDKTKIEVRRLEGYPVEISVNEELDKENRVITSEEELIDFLASIDKTNALTVEEKIDFDKEYLIGVASKTLDTGDHSFKIKKVYKDKEKDEILVSSRLQKPSDDCLPTEGETRIVDIVAISKTDKNVKFETLIETYTCSDE